MRTTGLAGASKRPHGPPRPRRPTPEAPQAPDLVRRDFTADAPDKLWVADITYLPSDRGVLYLAVVLDAFSRRVRRLQSPRGRTRPSPDGLVGR